MSTLASRFKFASAPDSWGVLDYPGPSWEQRYQTMMDEMVQAGKIRHIGCSNFSKAQLIEAKKAFASVQNQYSVLHRGDEAEVLPEVEREGLELVEAAVQMIMNGAKLVATNPDPNCPTQNGGMRPGSAIDGWSK